MSGSCQFPDKEESVAGKPGAVPQGLKPTLSLRLQWHG